VLGNLIEKTAPPRVTIGGGTGDQIINCAQIFRPRIITDGPLRISAVVAAYPVEIRGDLALASSVDVHIEMAPGSGRRR